MTTAAFHRPALADAFDGVYDMVVIGAGITGVHVAREAAGRGLRVALVDKGDVGGGTSSATTKYLHGGIRYLEQRQFGVVRDSLRERRILTLGATHLVEQRRFLMPGWSWSKPSTAIIGLGVALYTAMGFDRNRGLPRSLRSSFPRWVRKRRLLDEVPWLDPVGLRGAWAYDDTLNVHPERLLLSYVRDAVDLGATVRTHCAVRGFDVDDGRVVGVRVADAVGRDGVGGDVGGGAASADATVTISAHTVVNAAGPWMDVVLRPLENDDVQRSTRPLGVGVQRSKGVHTLTRPLGGEATVYCRSKTGNHVIVSPWQGHSFIGPTDTPIDADPDAVHVDRDDVDSILASVNSTLADSEPVLTIDDVEATTVGIRPLVDGGADSYTASRRHQLYDHEPAGFRGIWSIGGGKWTTGRATASATLDELVASPLLAHVRDAPQSPEFDSTTRPTFASPGWGADPSAFFDAALTTSPDVSLAPEVRLHLARLYGTELDTLLDLVRADPSLAAPISERTNDIAAQVVHAVTVEGALTLADIVDRRLVIGTVGPVTPDELTAVARLAAPWMGWNDALVEAEVAAEVQRRSGLEQRWRG
ncbi:glycerol-3-phosphate dehydrogenase/oxidase [Ilumatobacter coccineus]|uniref:Glycerol-3-phosphate dehydrogenase n=1 Tax=Ilumatobacter coccineus (strain NBRC 103263 / KCTC 29153 / YM16-304) TaxID=1313172 RepID=A0A6C7E8S7_ILUCY|nr:glycerol-3-phosphate dehydrogenase/oxidase [Ilumatobacter coccineus]BAN03117.1 glycerol-3-phosphate dehydrogenase [Ilumatobacter coccineus YM16-304]